MSDSLRGSGLACAKLTHRIATYMQVERWLKMMGGNSPMQGGVYGKGDTNLNMHVM